MQPLDLPRLNTDLARLLRERLQIRGDGLEAALRRAGRRLPRPVRKAGQELVALEALWQNPKLRRQIDQATVSAAEKRLRDHLGGMNAADRRRAYWIGVLAPLAFNALLVLALVTAWVAWRG